MLTDIICHLFVTNFSHDLLGQFILRSLEKHLNHIDFFRFQQIMI